MLLCVQIKSYSSAWMLVEATHLTEFVFAKQSHLTIPQVRLRLSHTYLYQHIFYSYLLYTTFMVL